MPTLKSFVSWVTVRAFSTQYTVQMLLKNLYITPKVSRFSFKYVIKATEMFHAKRKLTYISGAKPGSDPLQSSVSRTLFGHEDHATNFYQRFWHSLAI